MNPLTNFVKPVFVFACCLILSSCKDPGKSTADKARDDADPVGTWKIDSDATLAANQTQISRQLEKIPEANQAEARRKLEDMFRSVGGTMEFKPDNSLLTTTVFDGREMTMEGTWEINAGKVSTRAEGPDGEQVTTGAIQESQLKLMSGSDQCVVLRRE